MIWLAFLLSFISFGLIFFKVEPFWVQYLSFSICLALFVLIGLQKLPKSKKNSKWFKKYGIIISALALIAVVNIFARYNDKVFDVSWYQLYSLRPQSVDWLKKIEEPIEILIFLRSSDKTFAYAEWFQEETTKLTPNLKVKIQNINKDISLARRYNVTKTGEAVLVSGDQWIKVNNFKEKTLITGLMRLLSKTNASLCFTIGHGEPDIADTSGAGISTLHDFLFKLGYKTQAIELDQRDVDYIESECGTLILLGPKTDFLDLEAQRLLTIMENQKITTLFMLGQTISKQAKEILNSKGLRLTGRSVLNKENLKNKTPLSDITMQNLNSNPIVDKIKGKLFMPEVQAIGLTKARAKEFIWEPFLMTPANINFYLMGSEKQAGPFVVGAVATKDYEPKSAVFGSSKAFLNRNVEFSANRHIILSTISWLLKEQRITWVDAATKDERYMELTEKESFWISNIILYIIPGGVFLLCFAYWIRRRLKG
jgi:hypothetical protein